MDPRPTFLADNQIRGPVIRALRQWADVFRAVDLFGEENDDHAIFARAAEQRWILLTSDQDFHAIAHQWLDQGQVSFRMIFCRMSLHYEMIDGDVAAAIEAIVRRPSPFPYPIQYLRPTRG